MIYMIKKILHVPFLLKRKFDNYTIRKRLSRISADAARAAGKTGSRVRVLFGPSFSVYHALKIHDVLLSAAMTARGAHISYLSNPYTLQACFKCGGITQEASGDHALCPNCQRFTRNDANLIEYLKGFCNILKLKDFLDTQAIVRIKKMAEEIPADELEHFIFDEVPIGKYSALVVRNLHYVDNIKLIPDYQTKLRNAILTNLLFYHYFLAAIKANTPDVIITHEAFYAPWVLLYQLAKRFGITFYNYYPGMRNDSFFYAKDKIGFDLDMRPQFEKWRRRSISEQELKKIDIFFKKRNKGDIYDIKMARENEDAEVAAYQKIIRSKHPMAVLYANVLWDVVSLDKERVFNSVQESYLETVKFFIAHPEYNLIVKPHPADEFKGHESREPVDRLIKQAFPILPSHVLVLRPKSPLSSYELIHRSDVTIVHTTTVGIESPIFGKPTITLGKAHYAGQGLTYDPRSPEEYFQILIGLLDKTISYDRERIREQARKYYYLLNFVFWHDFGIIKYNFKPRSKAMVIPNTLDELLALKDFNDLVEAMLNKKEVPFFDTHLEKAHR